MVKIYLLCNTSLESTQFLAGMKPNQPKYNYWMDLPIATFQDQVHELCCCWWVVELSNSLSFA
jgi:hypothetical protein